MVDWVVVLTPLLALGALLLLGYAGCKYEPAAAPARLGIDVRVPTAITVTEIVFRCEPPSGPLPDDTEANPTGTVDGADTVYIHSCGDPVAGGWTVGCRVTASQGGVTATAAAQGTFVVDGSDQSPDAVFQASGNPAAGFAVAFVGVV